MKMEAQLAHPNIVVASIGKAVITPQYRTIVIDNFFIIWSRSNSRGTTCTWEPRLSEHYCDCNSVAHDDGNHMEQFNNKARTAEARNDSGYRRTRFAKDVIRWPHRVGE